MLGDTYYELLGVVRDSSAEEIRAAYRKLSKTHHPDHGGSDALFRQLRSAYEVLSNPQRRDAYDKSLTEASCAGEDSDAPTASGQPPPPPHNGWGFPPPYAVRAHGAPAQSTSLLHRGASGFSALARGHRLRRDESIAVAWIISGIVMLLIIASLVEPTHGLILLLPVGVGGVFWRRHHSRSRESPAR